MPHISKRGEVVPASPIRKLIPLANAAKARGTKVYHLNIGQPDLPTPKEGLDALHNIDRKILEYSPSDGIYPLRKKMSEFYGRFGLDISPDEIIVTTGASEATLFAFMASLDPGDEIIIPEPAYANYLSFAIQAEAVIVPVHSSIENGFALPPIEEFEKLITPRTKAVLICNPNNPTGYVYTRQELETLSHIVRKHDLYLFSDEVYREFTYTDTPYVSALQLDEIADQVVLLDSVSKRYSECGIRIGAMVTRNKELRDSVLKFCQARLSPPLIGQIVAQASIDAPEEYTRHTYEEYKKRRDFLIEGINRIKGCYSPMPSGAFYTVAQLPVDNAEAFCKWCLSEFTYEGATVMMAPAAGFYITPGLGENQVRIAYVLCVEDLAKALKVLEEALKVYPGRTV